MPFTSQVGRAQSCSRTERPDSPAVEIERVPLRPDVLRQFADTVVEVRDRDAPIPVVEGREDVGKDVDRIACGAAIPAGMEIAVGCRDDDLLADETAQHRRDGRLLAAPHAGIADKGYVAAQFLGILREEGLEAGAARFLLPLQDHRHADRQAASDCFPGTAGLDEGHQLPLVVSSTAGADAFPAIRPGFDQRLERRRRPLGKRVDRLHVVVTVEEDMGVAGGRVARAGAIVADDHGMAASRARGGVEVEGGELARKPVSGSPAAIPVGRVGRDTLDPQERKQTLDTCRQILVYALQYLVELVHRRLIPGHKRRPSSAADLKFLQHCCNMSA
jgi:hypothetical protein